MGTRVERLEKDAIDVMTTDLKSNGLVTNAFLKIIKFLIRARKDIQIYDKINKVAIGKLFNTIITSDAFQESDTRNPSIPNLTACIIDAVEKEILREVGAGELVGKKGQVTPKCCWKKWKPSRKIDYELC